MSGQTVGPYQSWREATLRAESAEADNARLRELLRELVDDIDTAPSLHWRICCPDCNERAREPFEICPRHAAKAALRGEQ